MKNLLVEVAVKFEEMVLTVESLKKEVSRIPVLEQRIEELEAKLSSEESVVVYHHQYGAEEITKEELPKYENTDWEIHNTKELPKQGTVTDEELIDMLSNKEDEAKEESEEESEEETESLAMYTLDDIKEMIVNVVPFSREELINMARFNEFEVIEFINEILNDEDLMCDVITDCDIDVISEILTERFEDEEAEEEQEEVKEEPKKEIKKEEKEVNGWEVADKIESASDVVIDYHTKEELVNEATNELSQHGFIHSTSMRFANDLEEFYANFNKKEREDLLLPLFMENIGLGQAPLASVFAYDNNDGRKRTIGINKLQLNKVVGTRANAIRRMLKDEIEVVDSYKGVKSKGGQLPDRIATTSKEKAMEIVELLRNDFGMVINDEAAQGIAVSIYQFMYSEQNTSQSYFVRNCMKAFNELGVAVKKKGGKIQDTSTFEMLQETKNALMAYLGINPKSPGAKTIKPTQVFAFIEMMNYSSYNEKECAVA